MCWLCSSRSTPQWAHGNPHGKGTVDRLHQLVAYSWTPQDYGLIVGYSGQLERWAHRAADLLAKIPTVALEVPCPRCEALWAYRHSDGQQLRARALRVSESGCECLACGAFWPPDRLVWRRWIGSTW